MAALPSFNVNKETLAFAAGIVGILTVGWNVVSYFKSLEPKNNPVIQEMQSKNAQQDQRLDRTDEDRANNTNALKEQTAETQKLKEAVVKLTTVLETNGQTKKAEYFFENIPPRPGAAIEVRR